MNLRRLLWRIGRRLYTIARGEPLNVIAENGELDVQAAVLRACARAGRYCCVCDVGANVGEWSLALLRQAGGTDVQVFAFEPVPGTRAMLTSNVAAAKLESVISIESVALSEASAARAMHVIVDGLGTNSLETQDSDLSESDIVMVETQTMTDFASARGLEVIDLVKVDTEGHDAFVIDGARPLLAAGRISVLQFEYNHRWVFARRYLRDVFDLVESLNGLYSLGRVRSKGIDIYSAWHPELERFFEANYLLIHRDALPWFVLHRGQFDASNTYA